MDDIKRFILPATAIAAVALLFFVVLFFALRSQGGDSINLSVTPQVNQADIYPAVVSALGATSSGNNASASKNDPLAAIRAIPEASSFVSLLEETGVASELSATGTYTFFVPTNAAFVSQRDFVSSLSFAEKKRLAEYHIVSGQMTSIDAVKFGHVAALSGDLVSANVFNTASVGSNARPIDTHYASDGIIYVIDHVLMPPERRPFPF